jgi:TP901 family phage tail tape measure protein
LASARISIGSSFDPKGLADAQRNLGDFKKGVSDLGDQAIKTGDKLNKALLGGLAATAGGAVLSIKAFADFDQKMTESTAIMGDLSSEMRNEMAGAAREVGKTTKFSANDAAEAFYFLASAGLDAATSIEALPKMAAFAQAGNFDMARATDILTDAQSALGLTSDDTAESMSNLGRVSDVFVKAATLANTSVEQLGLAFTSKAGAAVKAAGMEFEGAAAALAVFADSGVKGEAAGTKLTAVISSLQQGSRANAEAFEELGISVWDSRGNMLSLEEIVSDMENSFADMTVEQRNAALSQLGLNRQALDGINLLYGNSDAMNEYRHALLDAGGVTDEVAGKQMETFNARLGLLKDRLIDVAIGIGERLMPYVERLFDVLEQHIIPAVQEFAEKYLPVLRDQFEQVREKLEPLVRMLAEKLWEIITRVVGWMRENTDTVKVFFAVLAGAAVILMLVALAAKIAALFNPITLIIAVIALLAAGLYHAWKNSETFRDVVTKVFEVVKTVVQIAIRFVMGWFDALKTTITGFIKVIKGIFSGDLGAVMDGMKDIFSGAVKTVIQLFIGMPKAIWEVLGPSLLQFGKDIVGSIVSGIGSVAGNIGSAILGAIPGGKAIGGALGKVGGFLGFKNGGMIPGPINSPMPILAHGGEYVLSADIVNAIRKGAPSRGLEPMAPSAVHSGPAVVIENYTAIERSDDEMLIGMLEFAVRGGRL